MVIMVIVSCAVINIDQQVMVYIDVNSIDQQVIVYIISSAMINIDQQIMVYIISYAVINIDQQVMVHIIVNNSHGIYHVKCNPKNNKEYFLLLFV